MTFDPFPNGAPREVSADVYDVSEETIELHPQPDPDALPIFDWGKLDGPPPAAREWTLESLIPKGEVTLFNGPGGDGKSLFAQQLATCVAIGKPCLGAPTSMHDDNAVLYVTCEEDETELHRRQLNINRTVGATSGELDERLFLSSLRGRDENELATFDNTGELEKTKGWRKLFRTAVDTGADLIILDNVAHLFAGNENDRGQVTRFVNLLYSLVRKLGCTVLLIGHPNKSGDSYSGSTAWLNAVRSQITIGRVEDADGTVADPDRRVIRSGKANYAAKGGELFFRWHNHAFVLDSDLPSDTRKELAETDPHPR